MANLLSSPERGGGEPQRAGGVALLLAALALTGCLGHAPPPPTAQSSPDLKITLATRPPGPRQLDPTVFTVGLRDARGRPVTGAAVAVDLAMPAMDMGRNAVGVAEAAPGVYAGTGRFTMAGDWRVTVTAAHGPARSVRSFPISVQ